MSFDKKICFILVLGLAICEAHTLIAFIYPETLTQTSSLWLDNDYQEQLTIVYYLYELENILVWAIWFFAFWLVAKQYSKRLANVVCVFILYFLTQFCFYIYNRNTVVFSNIIIYIYIIAALLYIFIPDKKGKVVKIKK